MANSATNPNNYYQLYVNSVMQLAQTLVIKSADTADAQNAWVNILAQQGLVPPVDELTPTTWRYYMNLAGQYHPADTMMRVVSLDTLEEIDFTIANLAIHRATYAGYQFGTRQYEELVSLFPDQEILIQGILHPVDINVAIAAPDGKILYYDPTLVEENEYNLIRKIQLFIDGMYSRWVNKKYNMAHEYYPIVYHAQMYMFLPMEIMNIRKEACLTIEAHSYHVRSYLASHLGLDAYLDYMTTKQALYFYRNINYIERHTGEQATFDALLKIIMTERKLPLSAINMRHDLAAMPQQLDPTVIFDRIHLNDGVSATDSNTLNLDELLSLEKPLARNNATVQQDVEPVITEEMQGSLSNQLYTKVLESSMIDYSNSEPYNLPDILLNHWLYLSSLGYYEPYVFPISPVTGTAIPVTAKDAFVLMLYCQAQTYGIDLTTVAIPPFTAYRVQTVPKATLAQMQRVVPEPYRTDAASLMQLLLNLNPAITSIGSTQAFINLGQQITQAARYQRRYVAQVEDIHHHAYLFNAVDQIYADVVVSLAPANQTFADWMRERNIDLSGYRVQDYATLANAILQTATGQDLMAIIKLKDLQRAMVNLFSQLSSYSVQFIPRINESTLHRMDTPQMRIGDTVNKGADRAHIEAGNVDLLSAKVHAYDRDFIDFARATCHDLAIKTHYTTTVPVAPIILPGHQQVKVKHYFPMKVEPKITQTDVNGDEIPMAGIDKWFQLTEAEQSSLAEVMSDELFFWKGPNPQ